MMHRHACLRGCLLSFLFSLLFLSCGWSLPGTYGLGASTNRELTDNPPDKLKYSDGNVREVRLEKERSGVVTAIVKSEKNKEVTIERADVSETGTSVHFNIPDDLQLKRSVFYDSTLGVNDPEIGAVYSDDLSFEYCGSNRQECSEKLAPGVWSVGIWKAKELQSSFFLGVGEQPMNVTIEKPKDWLAAIVLTGLVIGDVVTLAGGLLFAGALFSIVSGDSQDLASLAMFGGLTGVGLIFLVPSGIAFAYGQEIGLYGNVLVEPKE